MLLTTEAGGRVVADMDRHLWNASSAVLVALPDGERAAEIARALAAEHLMPVMAFTTDSLTDFAADPNVTAVVVDAAVGSPPRTPPGVAALIGRVRAVTGVPVVLLGFVPGDGWGPIGDQIDGLLGADASAADVVGTVLIAVARRGGTADEVLGWADLVVDLRNYEAWQGPRRLVLTPPELRVLGGLVAAGGDVATKQDLQKAAWGTAGAHDDNRLQAHVRRLRTKLADPGDERTCRICTVRGVGFRLEPTGAFSSPPSARDPRHGTDDNEHEAAEAVARPSGPRR
jgi:DNA-binding winged helix-turn-helix (wHTH) protein